jgi:predicted hydrolase (HD superfamily)
MELALAAVDELSGFILACAYVRPAGFDGLTARSVKKKMKQRSFAAAVDRDAMVGTAEAFGVEFGEHVEVVIAALAPHASRLLAGDSAKEP